MPESTCSKCGQRLHAGLCTTCSAATAIAAAADHAPAPARPGAIHDDAPLPTIVKEYHDSFLRISLYYMVGALLLIASIGFGWAFLGR